MPKLGFWDREIPESHPKIPVVLPHLPHFALQNPKIALSRVSRQPPPRCSRGRGGGLRFIVICTGTCQMKEDHHRKRWQHQNQKKEESSTMGRDGSTSIGMVSTRGRELHLRQGMAVPQWNGGHLRQRAVPVAGMAAPQWDGSTSIGCGPL